MSEALTIRLRRSYLRIRDEACVIGVLQVPGVSDFVTLERPWLKNEKNFSCIPAGNYTCKRKSSPKFGDTFEVCDVVNRTHILFHALNWVEQSHGCIGVGTSVVIHDNRIMLTQSRKSMDRFMSALNCVDEFRLIIDSYAPTWP